MKFGLHLLKQASKKRAPFEFPFKSFPKFISQISALWC
jgi:hypothetical protein